MAEAFFNKLAGSIARAVSAGTMPATRINPIVVQVMKEVGLDLTQRKPKLLTIDMINQADRVITMGCGIEKVCPATFITTEDWQLEDPEGKPIEKIREIRDEIKSKIVKLINEIKPADKAEGGKE